MRTIFQWIWMGILVCLGTAALMAQTANGDPAGAGPACFSSDDCGEDQACIFPVGSCGEDGQAGACRVTVGIACYDLYQPVCGCNGVTYSNACYANAAGVSVRYEDECQDPETEAVEPAQT